MATHTIIGVMGPGANATATDCALAFELGAAIARQGWVLLTGGRNQGVMDAASRGAKAAGGLTLGILPGSTGADASPAVDIPILTGLGQARNGINVLSSRVVVACGFGAGTAAEIALAIKAQRPVVLVAYAPEVTRVFCQLAPQQVQAVPDVDAAIAHICDLLRHQAG